MIVNYTLPDGPRAGESRPAIVVRWQDLANRIAVLYVFTDGLNDSPRFHDAAVKVVAAKGKAGEPGRWYDVQP
jgi:hypothetical protein